MNDDVPSIARGLEIKHDRPGLRRAPRALQNLGHHPFHLLPGMTTAWGHQGRGAGGFRNRLSGDVPPCFHRMVISAFCEPCPPDVERCGSDDDQANNMIWNLGWTSRSSTIENCVRNGNHNTARRSHCGPGHAYRPENTRTGKPEGCRCVRAVRNERRYRYARDSYRLTEEASRRHAPRRARFNEAM